MKQSMAIDCPTCHGDAVVTDYDYGIDRETGYHDAGRILRCFECGEELRDREIDQAFEEGQ